MSYIPDYNKRKPKRSSALTTQQWRGLWIAGGALLLALLLCVITATMALVWFNRSSNLVSTPAPAEQLQTTWASDSAELTIVASPLMAPVLQNLAERFNAANERTPDNQRMRVAILPLEPEQMVQQAQDAPYFQAISPDSSLWLDRLEQAWQAKIDNGARTEQSGIPLGQSRTSETMRYAISPIVIAAWESVGRDLGWPNKAISWQDIQRKAASDPNFKWSHPSTGTATGLLATLAEFYAGAGVTRGLTEQLATAQDTIDYVKAIEGTVRFYGEGEEVVVERLLAEGRNYLDAFVAQERVVIDWNENRAASERLVAIYPVEGAFWADHPLTLLQLGSQLGESAVTDNQRLTYRAFVQYLGSPTAQDQLLANGYRPADLNIALDREGSPFANSDAVDWRQPQTTLQMPAPSVIDVVLNFWYYTKRPTNVYLVIDTSGSMEGAKLERAKQALASFIDQIQGDRDQIALVEFGSGTKNFTPLTPVSAGNRQQLQSTVQQMEASGGTALIDAVYAAADDLAQRGASDAINAIVVMTDGKENQSYYDLAALRALLRSTQPAPVVFTIAFGDDADEEMLNEMARIGSGQFRRATEIDIQELYKIISTYF